MATDTINFKSDEQDAQIIAVDTNVVPAPGGDIENGQIKPTLFSRLSVWLNLIFLAVAQGSDGYNAAVVGNISLLFTVIYPETLTHAVYSRLSNAFIVGMIIGMLFFGWFADQFGRKSGAIATTALLVLGIALSSAASGVNQNGMFWMLIVARGLAGVGAGGEYPVTGAGAAEASNESSKYRKRRGFFFAVLGEASSSLGYCFGTLIPLLLLLCVHQRVDRYELVWRLSFGLGMLPPLLIFWFRMRMAVSTSFRQSAMRRQRAPYLLIFKRYWRQLLGASLCWFTGSWISIPFGIFSSTIVSRANPTNSLVTNLGWGVVINCFYLPGPFLGGYLADKIGRRQTMALGFAIQSILGFILAGAYQKIQRIFPLLVVLYGLFLTGGEIGSGSTILLVSTEPFPTAIRAQAVGFIAAVSKAGAAIGIQVFTTTLSHYGKSDEGNQVVFFIGAAFAVLGVIFTFILVDAPLDLDIEDQAWKEYLAANGWGATWGDDVTIDPPKVLEQRLEQRS